MAIIRLGIFPDQTIQFHVVIFIAAFTLFVIAWETLLLIHNYFEGKFPIGRNPTTRILIQIFLTTILFTIFSKALFLSGSYFFKIEISSMLDKVLYLLNFLLAVIFNLTLFGTQYFFQWKRDVVMKANLEKEQVAVKYDALRNQLNPHFLFNALTSLNSLVAATLPATEAKAREWMRCDIGGNPRANFEKLTTSDLRIVPDRLM